MDFCDACRQSPTRFWEGNGPAIRARKERERIEAEVAGLMHQMYEQELVLDPNDPNYDLLYSTGEVDA